ncbi:MAG TPA: RHS repeat-associated core domain-containing protein, partial [Anaerolineales bacterium]|nr:RHS repeat-associated core domain-containing protein [Anaerolineales bacterium]
RADPTPITQTDFGYTGQRALPDTGLMDYKARFYSPSLGRFLSADTIVPEAGNPQALNSTRMQITTLCIIQTQTVTGLRLSSTRSR